MNLQELLCAYQLGTLLSSTPLPGGLLHKTQHVITDHGEFAIKELNQTLEQFQYLETTEAIARAAKAKGFPARTALLTRKQAVYRNGDHAYLVYPYLQAQPISLKLSHLSHIAQASARLHQLDLQLEAAPAFQPFVIKPHEWQEHAGSFEPLLRKHLPIFLEIYTHYPAAFARLAQQTVVSHRDFTPANLLWQDESSFIVIDWELAGLINPELEMLNNAMDVAITADTVKADYFYHYLQAYRAVSPALQQAPQDLIYACLGSWVFWILFCLKRHNQSFKPIDTEQMIRKTHVVIDFLLENAKNIELALST